MSPRVAVIGAGPAGLMAAEAASGGGAAVTVYDQMPSVARKFLMAGKSGLNITHTEDDGSFRARYRDERMAGIVEAFGGSRRVRAWMAGLGIAEHIGSSGRVFPVMMKASPLLRAWLRRLDGQGVVLRTRHRLCGWDGAGGLRFATPDGQVEARADAVIFATGGGSWRRLGSDGAWADLFERQGIRLAPFRASNAGLRIGWSDVIRQRFEGAALKSVAFSVNGEKSRGEAVLTARGLEGGGVYPLARALEQGGTLTVDLLPDLSEERIAGRLARQNPKQSLANRLRKGVRIDGVKAALLREGIGPARPGTPQALARRIKALPLQVQGLAPLDEAISTAGGVPWSELEDNLMLVRAPGVFCAGEMIAWDAPTGGYLLTACLATGDLAGRAAIA